MLKYKIDKIIELKETMIRGKEREIEDAALEVKGIVLNIRMTEETIHKSHNGLGAVPMKGSDFSVLKDYLSYLEKRKDTLIEEKEDREKKISSLRSQLFELAKEKKMFEKLKSRITASLRKSFNRRQQKLLDDIALRIDTQLH
ncbi:MAG: flagellar FliJ family protein [Syntrophorhabdaceae bacterium]|nr:flagellar FliJ family protein [Syntrophorhabdaceae bacterium]